MPLAEKSCDTRSFNLTHFIFPALLVTLFTAGGLHAQTTVSAWGTDESGDLGIDAPGSIVFLPEVVVVGLNGKKKLEGAVEVIAGYDTSLAVKRDGTIWGWGEGTAFTSAQDSPVPVELRGFAGFESFSAGLHHILALKRDGTVWGWGTNLSGELGDQYLGTSTTTPVRVHGLRGVVAVSSGNNHSIALMSDGTVWAFGSNAFGQLGNGSSAASSPVPVQVSHLTDVRAIAANIADFSLALKADGTVWAWGSNLFGTLGDGVAGDFSNLPVQVKNLNGVAAIATGSLHAIALRGDGTVWTWGLNDLGQLGNGATTNSALPIEVGNLDGVFAIAGGLEHSVAVKRDGTLWTWGSNLGGDLGTGSSAQYVTLPAQVTGLKRVFSASAGGDHTLALTIP